MATVVALHHGCMIFRKLAYLGLLHGQQGVLDKLRGQVWIVFKRLAQSGPVFDLFWD